MARRIFEEKHYTVRGHILPRDAFHPMGRRNLRPTAENAARLIAEAEQFLTEALPPLSATDYAAFRRTGDRTVFDKKYQTRRKMCLALALAEALEGKGRFTEKLADVVWAMLEETTWVVPAHLSNPAINRGEPDRPVLPYAWKGTADYIDLYAGISGAVLAVTLYFAGDALDRFSPEIRKRTAYELNRRILTPFLDRSTWMASGWQGWDGIRPETQVPANNWAPWITGNILTVAAFCEPEAARREEIVSAALPILDNFTMCYGADGACEEGPSYWAMAPGKLFASCELLYDLSDGYIDLFGDPLIRRMGESETLVSVTRNRFLTYADAFAGMKANVGLLARYGERCRVPQMLSFAADRLAHGEDGALRDLWSCWESPYDWLCGLALEIPQDAPAYQPPKRVLLEDFELFIAREFADEERGLYLAVKGGHNDTSHNHNDVGAVSVFADGQPILLDAGAGTYTAKTFGPERYTVWNTRSDYHNLPTVCGADQKQGREYRATGFCAGEDFCTVELRDAYGAEAGIRSFRRTAALRGGKITLTDDISLSAAGEVVFRLLTDTEPEQCTDGAFVLHGRRLTYPAGLVMTVEEVEHTSPETARIPTAWGVPTLWRINLTSKTAAEHHVTIEIG